jgi:LPPG:FO 2-phospho-L-lactate transferase
VVLAGGVGGAKFLLGVKRYLGRPAFGAADPGASDDHTVTAIVNTADDIRLHNLQVCPDLDSCMYTLSGVADLQRGWGRADETWTVSSELAGYDAEAPWFSLGDRDIATHLIRTRMLDAGYRLSDVTAALCRRWRPGVTLLPMTDDRVETHVVVTDPTELPDPAGTPAPLVALHFQEWWIRYQAKLPALSITPIGAEESTPGPGVLDTLADADLVLVAPSNPVVSIGPILAVPGVADALHSTKAPVVAVSPIIGSAPVRGHADRCLEAVDVPVSAQGVGRHYGARSDGGLLDAYLIADGDRAIVPGVTVAARPLLMTEPDRTAAMVAACVEVAGLG